MYLPWNLEHNEDFWCIFYDTSWFMWVCLTLPLISKTEDGMEKYFLTSGTGTNSVT